MGILNRIREFFWPLLEPLKIDDFKPFHTEDLTIEENDLDLCCDLTLRYYDSEDARKKAIESKSTIFVSAIGFVIAILLSMATGLVLNPNIKAGFLTSFSILMWVVIVVYFCRTVWFSIRALERQEYHTIGYKDFISGGAHYRRNLITDIINKTRKNSLTINIKVDFMVMAQGYFKRGISAAVIYCVVAGAYGIIFKTRWNFNEIMTSTISVLSNRWLAFLNATFFAINIAIFWCFYLKSKGRN